MKHPLFILLFLLMLKSSFSQDLEGEWNGSFKDKYEAISIPAVPITLKFMLNKDSSYTVHSFTQFEYYQKKKYYYDTSICLVYFKSLGPDSIYLEEKKVLNPKNDTSACFQKMNLKFSINKDDALLTGTWEGVSPKCGGVGPIRFIRKRK